MNLIAITKADERALKHMPEGWFDPGSLPLRPRSFKAEHQHIVTLNNMKRLQDFSKNRFREWLSSLPPDEVVGHSGNAYNCPLARFMRVAPNGPALPSPSVGAISMRVSMTPHGRMRMPKWAKNFVSVVDGDNWHADTPITASAALAALQKSERRKRSSV